MAGLQVLVRSLLSGTVPLVSDRVDAEVIAEVTAAAPGVHVSLVPTQLRRLLDAGAPLRELGTILLGGAAPPPAWSARPWRAGGRVRHHLRDVGDLRRLRVQRQARWTASGCGRRRRAGSRSAGPVLFSGYWPGGAPARLPAGPPGSEAAADGWFTTSDLGELRRAAA